MMNGVMGRRDGKARTVSALDTEMEIRMRALVPHLEAGSRPRRIPLTGTHSGKFLCYLLNLVLLKQNGGGVPFCTAGKGRKSRCWFTFGMTLLGKTSGGEGGLKKVHL